VEVGPHRDLVAEVSEAVRAKGLRMGLYYSLSEWFHPWTSELITAEERDYPRYVEEHMLPQMKDIVERYKPAVLFPDGHWTATTETWRSREFLAWLFNESSVRDDIAVNDRWGYSPEGENTMGKHGGFFTPEYDEISHEEKIEFEETHPWAECRGVGTSFGYNRNEDTSDYLSEKALIHLLIEKVSRGYC
jgi:alpha-L-fucosidase